MTTPHLVTPHAAFEMVQRGAILIDIRAPDEHRRENIPGARSVPLATLPASLPEAAAQPLIFHCKTGMRTAANAQRLAGAAGAACFILEGGLDGWKQAGLPVSLHKDQPLDIMRQVQIAAGALVLLGVALGALVAPPFYAVSAFVGAGLLTAGLTGHCGMARLLTWLNRRISPV
jgi:rhodanese-related sulfurtransferase